MKKFICLFSMLFLLLFFRSASVCYAQLSDPLPFMTPFVPKSTQIVEYKDIDSKNVPSALVRLPNRKLAYMVRENNELKPYYINALETGWWDGLYNEDTDLDAVFKDMKSMGANTALVMIHWENIEPSDNHFDFSFTDSLVAAAARQNMKIWWVLFLHTQKDIPNYPAEGGWTFHLDDRDGSNYTMQWPKRDGVTYTTIEGVMKNAIKPLHAFGHPEIFYRIRRMLYNLAVQYKKSETVIGVQVGNEECFSYWDESDLNPETAKLFEEWKLKTNKQDYAQFKKDAFNWWWSQFTSAFHEGDPYKLLSTNLHAGQAEEGVLGDLKVMSESGTSASTYGDGNLDAIGTMFYQPWGYNALLGLDRRYGNNAYNYELPILIPSEIGLGARNGGVVYKHFVVNTLERGAQGLGVYSYGKVRKEKSDKEFRDVYVNLNKMINSSQKIIYGGLPGPGMVTISTDNDEAKVSHLNTNKKETLAMIYFPDATSNPESSINKEDFPLKIDVEGASNNYQVLIQQDGKELFNKLFTLKKDVKAEILLVKEVSREDVLFVSVIPLYY
ncbi:hypothetical protein ACUNWD_06550 [Sunxiuqinia sp. A32]|uniref:hypothetical protein n=1 Tax=Sunxiuqinia sp. A32 TaxID=3461496 RepID=UPI004045960D